jgi:hypothetical protein
MHVLIIDSHENGKVVAKIPISLRNQKFIPLANECFKIAWDTAVIEGLVKNKDRSRYEFSFE